MSTCSHSDADACDICRPDSPVSLPIDGKPLHCPFCGHADSTLREVLRDGYEHFKDDPDAYAYTLACHGCAAEGGWAKSATGARRNWNLRVSRPSAPPPSSACANPNCDGGKIRGTDAGCDACDAGRKPFRINVDQDRFHAAIKHAPDLDIPVGYQPPPSSSPATHEPSPDAAMEARGLPPNQGRAACGGAAHGESPPLVPISSSASPSPQERPLIIETSEAVELAQSLNDAADFITVDGARLTGFKASVVAGRCRALASLMPRIAVLLDDNISLRKQLRSLPPSERGSDAT